MKRFLLPAICLLLVFTSCKKKNDVTPVNTLTATVDGINMNFNSNMTARIDGNFTGTGNIDLVVEGFATNGSTNNMLGISFITANLNSITAGTYTAANANNTPPIWAAITYNDNSSASTHNYLTYTTVPFTITITSISKTNIQGTFSGVVADLNNSSNTKTITNGKFNVNIQQ
ncbi:MAG: hypothetical protein JSU01_07655 [Bacteroidetes bacterium]|nr:hypothetical protein [Bacteroidota bacterium]